MKKGYVKASLGIWSIAVLVFSVGAIAYGTSQKIQTANAEATATDTSTSSTSCSNLTVSKVVASSDDGNVPNNVLDNNLGTRWSGYGIGSFIKADLGLQKTICYVDIAFYKGNERTNNFVIAVSKDGSAFTNVFSGKSSGTTLSFERFDFADVSQARYVKITVNGNTQNNWASITELKVYGLNATATPTPTPTPTPGNTTTSPGNDKFGVKEIYPTKSGGDEWFMNMANPTSDPRFHPEKLTKNSDGSWKNTATQVRMNVYTAEGYHPDRIETYNQKVLAQKGYMQSANDWKNVEITGYVKVNKSPSDDNFAWYARGGRHTHNTAPNGENQECEGTAYKGGFFFFSGKTRFAKEQWHNGGYSYHNGAGSIGSLKGKFVGLKTVMYNFQLNGKTAVKMENYVDYDNNNNWKKVYETVDNGGWGTEGDYCGGSPDQLITWGGPEVTFRWDTATDVDFKNLSVREIQPPVA